MLDNNEEMIKAVFIVWLTMFMAIFFLAFVCYYENVDAHREGVIIFIAGAGSVFLVWVIGFLVRTLFCQEPMQEGQFADTSSDSDTIKGENEKPEICQHYWIELALPANGNRFYCAKCLEVSAGKSYELLEPIEKE